MMTGGSGSSSRFPEFCEEPSLRENVIFSSGACTWAWDLSSESNYAMASNDPVPTSVARVASTLLQDGCGEDWRCVWVPLITHYITCFEDLHLIHALKSGSDA